MAQVFEVDRKGLAKLLRSKGIHRMVEELVSNAFDEAGVTEVNVELSPTDNGREYRIVVEDNSPEGFQNLDHAYTLFAESYKKSNPLQRGRFNFGEKWVIATCKWASISTTKGTVVFEENERHNRRVCRENGTRFEGLITSTKDEIAAAVTRIRSIIPPDGIKVTINGIELDRVYPCRVFETTLPTIIENENGELVRTNRKTTVSCYEVLGGELPTIYEMGIPVVAFPEDSGDPYHLSINQKVPLSFNRDNVPPKFLKLLRTAVLDNTFDILSKEQATGRAITEAMENAIPDAVTKVMTDRFGEKRAIYDPSDLEANNRLTAEGYTIIPSNSFDRSIWSNVKSSGAAVASGTIRPTPKPYSDDPNAPIRKLLDPSKMTDSMKRMEQYIRMIANNVCGKSNLTLTWVNDFKCDFGMCCGENSLDINVSRLGYAWFDCPPATTERVDNLLLHEFGHFRELNHLSEKYYDALTEYGSRLGILKLTQPELFKDFR